MPEQTVAWPPCHPSLGNQAPAHQDIQRIAEDQLLRLQFSCAALWSQTDALNELSALGQSLQQHLAQRPQGVRERMRSQARALRDPKVAPQVFGRYAALDPLALLHPDQGAAEPSALEIEAKRLISGRLESPRIQGDRTRDIWNIPTNRPSSVGQEAALRWLSFRIDRVKCIDETNPEWWGQDQIALAGLAVHANGQSASIAPERLGEGFDDGDELHYRPAKSCHRFDLAALSQSWTGPQNFLVALLLAEKDRGEMHHLLDSAWAQVHRGIQADLQKAVGASVREVAGPWLSSAVSSASAWVLQEFFRWIQRSFLDDLFAPAYCWIQMEHPNSRFTQFGTWGSPRSPELRAHFFGYGGHYAVDFHWTLHD